MIKEEYGICKNCVMDTSDPEIKFDEQGICNHCIEFDAVTSKHWWPNEEGEQRLNAIYTKIKKVNKNKKYDCILGLSGGVDSSYLALKLFDIGLRPLVIHVDAGWNSELAVQNIEKLVKYCGWDLHTIVIDWQDMKELQLSYLKSGISNQDVPQDHAFFASLYYYAIKHNIRYVLSGGNVATESIFPNSWLGDAMDSRNLKAIQSAFGTRKLRNYKVINFWQYYFYFPFVKKMKVIRPLNYMPYIKKTALAELKERVGYKEYPRKHGESIFTKVYQNYYLPKKFGFDKRRPHLSSLIVSDQISRDEALRVLAEPLYDEQELADDLNYFCKKLGLSESELQALMGQESFSFDDFPNNKKRHKLLKKIQSFIQDKIGKRFTNYS